MPASQKNQKQTLQQKRLLSLAIILEVGCHTDSIITPVNSLEVLKDTFEMNTDEICMYEGVYDAYFPYQELDKETFMRIFEKIGFQQDAKLNSRLIAGELHNKKYYISLAILDEFINFSGVSIIMNNLIVAGLVWLSGVEQYYLDNQED